MQQQLSYYEFHRRLDDWSVFIILERTLRFKGFDWIKQAEKKNNKLMA